MGKTFHKKIWMRKKEVFNRYKMNKTIRIFIIHTYNENKTHLKHR